MSPIDKALEALSLLEPGERFQYSEYAKKFGCSRSTLSKRHRGVQGSCASKVENDRLLNNAQESQLIQYISELCRRGLPPSKPMIRNFATQIAQKNAGKNWADRFVQRHCLDLVSHWASGLDRQRFKADSAFKYKLYFELLRRKIEQYKVEKEHIYNMDEKGFMIGVLSRMKRVFSKELYEHGKIKSILQDGNREWVTTIACICADGSALPPALIYQAQSGNIQDTWLQDFDPAQHRGFFTSSPSGWTSNDIGLAWLKLVFDRHTKEKAEKARRAWRLLILDGHGSHVTMDFISYCDANRILLMVFPPHSTHTLQPLDVVMFSPLAAAYKAELAAFMDRCQGLTSITKRDFYKLFNAAWSTSFISETIVQAFKVTGIAPLEPNEILKKFKAPQQSEASRPSSSDSTSSVLSASDWRKIERLLRQAVDNIYDSKSAQLSQTIHTISVKNQLLKHENESLKEALANEKRRRQRGKALLLQKPDNWDGGAILWSPAKVADARHRQELKDLEEQQEIHQKSEAARLREEQKIAKAQLLEQRRLNRVAAKEERERLAAEKALQREEDKMVKQLAKQLQNDLKLSQEGKRQSLKAPRAAQAPVVDSEPAEVEEVVLMLTRRGRPIRPPKKLLT